MLLREFIVQHASTEDNALQFLRDRKVLESEGMQCPGRSRNECKRVMREEVLRNGRRRWRCPRKDCNTTRSVRAGNAFFHYTDGQGRVGYKLPLHDVLIVVWLWLHARMPQRMVTAVTGVTSNTIVDWNNFARMTCGKIMDSQPKLVGTEEAPVKIDESYVCGRRKYNRGRLLAGDKALSSGNVTDEDDANLPDWNDEHPEHDDGNTDNKEDFVQFGVDDPFWRWVLGIWQSPTQCRFIRVPNRTKRTLNAVISRYVEPGSFIHTDSWGGYNDLNSLGYVHLTVNHSVNYVDPDTGAHTNDIEGAWNSIKAPYKRMRGNRKHLQSHLDEAAWRMFRSAATEPERLLDLFLEDVRVLHNTGLAEMN